MSNICHIRLLVRSLEVRYSGGSLLASHSHTWAQLIYASEGVMTVRTVDGTWVVPSHRAVWIPAGVEHSIEMSGWVFMRTLYFAPEFDAPLPDRCCVVPVSPLLRELILHTVALGPAGRTVPRERRLIEFLRDQLESLPVVPVELPMPRDPRALRVARMLTDRPGDGRRLDALAHGSGASRRTLERLFRAETNMTFGRWRQQLRLLHALRLLASGEPVTWVASEVGYESPSAFISMFRTTLGTTPGRYYSMGS